MVLPPDFNQNSEPNGFQGNGADPTNSKLPDRSTPPEAEPVSLSPAEQERVQNTTHQLQRLFVILVSVGAGAGLIIAIALVLMLSRFGLVGSPQESAPSRDSLEQSLNIGHSNI